MFIQMYCTLHSYYSLLNECTSIYLNSYDYKTINSINNLVSLLTINQNKHYVEEIKNKLIKKTGYSISLKPEQYNIFRQVELDELVYKLQDIKMFEDNDKITYYDLSEIGENEFMNNIYNINKTSANHSLNIGKGELLLSLNSSAYKCSEGFTDLKISNKLIEVKGIRGGIYIDKTSSPLLFDILHESNSYKYIDNLNLIIKYIKNEDTIKTLLKKHSIKIILSSLILSLLNYDNLNYLYLYNSIDNRVVSAVSIPIGQTFDFYLEGLEKISHLQLIGLVLGKGNIRISRYTTNAQQF